MTEKEINVVRVLCVAYFFLNEREFGLMARALYQFLSGSRLGNAHCPRYLDFDDEGMRTVQSRTDLPVHRSFVSI